MAALNPCKGGVGGATLASIGEQRREGLRPMSKAAVSALRLCDKGRNDASSTLLGNQGESVAANESSSGRAPSPAIQQNVIPLLSCLATGVGSSVAIAATHEGSSGRAPSL